MQGMVAHVVQPARACAKPAGLSPAAAQATRCPQPTAQHGVHQQQEAAPALLRRELLLAAVAVAVGAASGGAACPPARASGLLQLPLQDGELHNSYYLVRAGQSQAEAEGYVLTNPVAKTSTTSGLSDEGKRQVVAAYRQLRNLGLDSAAWVWPSITQNAYQSAEILGALLGVGRSRIVPEFSFLDARGVGELERLPLGEAAAALAAGDALAATWRPGPNTDGTVHESSADVLVRGRQLLSLLETQYVGDSVVIISPDSDNLSILQAGVLGVDLRSHLTYAFQPGEVRILRLQSVDEERAPPPASFACPRPPQCV